MNPMHPEMNPDVESLLEDESFLYPEELEELEEEEHPSDLLEQMYSQEAMERRIKLEEQALSLRCSVELAEYIDEQEAKIQHLEKMIEHLNIKFDLLSKQLGVQDEVQSHFLQKIYFPGSESDIENRENTSSIASKSIPSSPNIGDFDDIPFVRLVESKTVNDNDLIDSDIHRPRVGFEFHKF